MSLLDALRRGWWAGWSEPYEMVAGGAGLLESLIPGHQESLQSAEDWANEQARGMRLEGGTGQSEGLLEKITEGLGAAPGQLSMLAPFMAVGPAGWSATAGGAAARTALGFGLHGLIRHGDEGLPTAVGQGLRGAAEGAVFGGLGHWAGGKFIPKAAEPLLKKRRELTAIAGEEALAEKALLGERLAETGIDSLANQLKRKALHGASTGGFVGGMTKLHGGDLEDAVAAGSTMGLLGMLASGKYKEPSMAPERALRELEPDIKEYARKADIEAARLKARPVDATEQTTAKEVFETAKSLEDPTRTTFAKSVFNNMSPEQQMAALEGHLGHKKYGTERLMRAVQRGGLDDNGKVMHKASVGDAFEAELNLADIHREQAGLAKKRLRAEEAKDEFELNNIKLAEDALALEEVAAARRWVSPTSTMGSGLRAIGLARRYSPEWFEAVRSWEKATGKPVADRVRDLAKLSNGDPELLSRLGHAINRPKMWDYFQEYWINGLLSGIPTQAVNVSSNALRSGIDVVEKSVALMAEVKKGKLTKDEAIGEITADIKAGWAATGPALKAFARLLNEDYKEQFIKENPRLESHTYRSKLDHPTASIPGLAGKIIRFPGTALQAMDIAFKIIAGERYATAKAYRMALDKVKSGEIKESQFKAEMDKLNGVGAEPHPDVLKAMKENAQRLTFTQPLGPGMQKALAVRDMETWMPIIGKGRPGTLVAPFVSTPWNVIKAAVARSPLGLLRLKRLKAEYENPRSKMTPQEYYRELAGTWMGTTLTVGLIGMAKAGFITGGGPVNQQDRQNLLSTGWRPYSVKVGDAYIQLQRLEPFGTVLGMAGDLAELGDSDDKAGKMIATIKDNMTDKSFLYGLETFAKAFANPEQFGSIYLRQMEGSLVPTFFAKAAQAVDPYQRQQEAFGATAGVPDSIAYRLPGVSTALPQKTSALGEPRERWGVMSADTPAYKALSGLQSVVAAIPVSVERQDREVEKEFNRLRGHEGMPPSMPRRSKKLKLRGVDGTDVELTTDEYQIYDRYHAIAKDQLAKIIASPQYKRMPEALQAELLRSTYRKFRSAASKQVNAMIMRRTTVGS